MVKKILLVLVALVAVLVLVVAMQPADFSVERSATMAAPPEKVFAQVNDFHNWEAWSPWAKLDPKAKNSFEGPTSGEGAVFKWAGNEQVGEGMMTITDSQPNELVKIKLEFIKPFAGTNTTTFAVKPVGDQTGQTKIVWTMTGHNDFMGKAFCLVMNGKEMIGKDFDKGLASMKAIVEEKSTSENPTKEEKTVATEADSNTEEKPNSEEESPEATAETAGQKTPTDEAPAAPASEPANTDGDK